MLCGCSSSASNNASSVEKTYDEEFMTAWAKGLEERWEIADSNNLEESAELYASLEQSELDCVEEYSEKNLKIQNFKSWQLLLSMNKKMELK